MFLKKLLKYGAKKVGIKNEDYTKKYWKTVASKNLPHIMDRITTNYTPDDFAKSKDTLVFTMDMKFDKSMVVLDLACGLGRTCKWVAPFVAKYIGVDFVTEMVQKATEYNSKHLNAYFLKNNGKDLDILEDNSVDLAYSELAFQHMPRSVQKSYINDLKRVIKPDGKFYAQIPKLKTSRKETSWSDAEIVELFKDWAYYEQVEIYDVYYSIIATPKLLLNKTK